MFMNSNLSTYHISLFGGRTNAISTEIGGDQRSLFLRPITAAGETSTYDASTYAVRTDVKRLPPDYSSWRKSIDGYNEAAAQSKTSDSSAKSDGGGNAAAVAVLEDATAGLPVTAPAGDTAGVDENAATTAQTSEAEATEATKAEALAAETAAKEQAEAAEEAADTQVSSKPGRRRGLLGLFW
ncbi:hypothetical protein [Paracoccus fistulariae]|uniref:Uncharacterized protein n=1 Tax=Paracoccus fistulariae TaxID=658446 RepID=A0ABY7SN38_9RHOB|nr:hypothetical protein [Paracoccus fistulariae]MDB6180147.1 hypothetical protein [Paracoccus fistulariae]WCR08231.1 hypothetical protein JHX87_05300 [Paracoccus fistulariae]